ncbi:MULTISPECIES: aromatic ring-hydroxylating dioxygenase subunit alpha [unclassified Paracoccus (in: a-proteobacteria)]|uniref:aromatic ring-hydroxylating oxygenase subunit alpha n=1 Tax=unclassified Paracoccus (in: a-proteobacteria) TaxID=2688777 RepID=UPI0016033D0A|nr:MULTISPECIES: aromatic ring-hydroxylating dioxygenase subunit alpha [unclassified Paracoccus (in: a-proteobacteria)]MBB1492654.1 aromatic ring-hydroxylating dioxygenase subunit alpha [Paracoccus sp. MC1854]MBB1499217.1 aromatic ring-hydroxylating dioxygenase subunit alpha [Paracoccus sp. MC1862]QQO45031.1 aromatic ring-hydroxylating dioxygenase subunit alpha [Paracoccus sp. MC1862]
MLDKSPFSTISTLLDERVEGRSLPAGLYTREDVFQADLEVLFRKHWIYIGPECDVPEPGDAVAIDIGGSSLIMLRDDDGELRVFHNVCRHRGARILDAGTTVVSKLVCPYHQWTYELTGELAHAPHMGKDFDKTCNSLRHANFRNIGGLIHVCLSDDPPADIAALEAVGRERLLPYDLKNTRVAHQTDLIENGNWKLTMENNRECYHCSANHPELCVSFIDLDFGFDPESLSPEDRETADRHEAMYAAQTAEWEAQGHPSAAIEQLTNCGTNFRTQRLIISGAGESQTPDATAAVSKLLGIGRKDLGDMHLWGHNSWHHFMGDHIITAMVIPLGPDKTMLRMKWLVHKDAVEGVDYDFDKLTSVWIATNEQDGSLVGRSHAGVSDPAYVPGMYSPFTETQLNWFAGWYVDRMRAHGY